MPEGWYRNPGSCSRRSKNELREHTGSKQAKFLLKGSRELPGLLGGGRRAPLSRLSYRGFYLLKVGRGPKVGPRKMWFSPIGPIQLPVSTPCFWGWKCPENSIFFFFCPFLLPFLSFHFYQWRSGVEILIFYSKQSLGGMHLSYNKTRPVGMLVPEALKPQMLINGHIKECIEAHASTPTP